MDSQKRPLVSVIMPTYNCAKFIAESVKSVLAQTLTGWELQIVDDCSKDNTYEVLTPYLEKYPNIHYYRLEKNGGPQAARTEAMRRAVGRYIAFFDSDDLWSSDKLEKQVAFMQRTGAQFSCTAYEQMDENGVKKHIAFFPPENCDYRKMLRLSNPIGNTTVMYDQDALGKFEVPNIKKRNDFALWLKILKNCDYCYGMQEILATYRVRTNSVSSNKIIQAKYHWQLYYEIEKLGPIKSGWYVFCWAWVKGTGCGIDKRVV